MTIKVKSHESQVTRLTAYVSTLVVVNDEVLMVQEGEKHAYKWNFPSGHLDADEDLIEAAVREVREETGYMVKIDNLITVQTSRSGGETNLIFFFEGSLVGNEPGIVEEDIEQVSFVSLSRVPELDLRHDDLNDIINRLQNGETYPLNVIMEKGEIYV